ncbi:MAG: hypothetical protein ABI367_02660 [Mucilaginibacter sp.]
MKNIFKLLLPVLAVISIFSACSGIKNLPAAATGATRGHFVGTWTLNNVAYDGLLRGSVQTVFDQAQPDAFIGSTWQLTNSGNGIYTLNGGTSQTIFWSVYNDKVSGTNQFQFKKIYQGDAPKNVTDGYRLIIDNNDGNTMTLRSPVDYNGKTGYVVYSFSKNK